MNELFVMAESLRRGGVDFTSRHPRIQSCPFKPRVTVMLDRDGQPAGMRLEPRKIKDQERCERWAQDNQNAYPTFSVSPVLEVNAETLRDVHEALKKHRGEPDTNLPELIRRMAEEVRFAWPERQVSRVGKMLRLGRNLLDLLGEFPPHAAPLVELTKRTEQTDPFILGKHLAEHIQTGLAQSPLEWIGHMDGFLVPSGKKSKGTPALITLELVDWAALGSANSKTVFDALDACLRQTRTRADTPPDAYGLPLEEAEALMPKVALPKLPFTPIRSMFGEVPANFRYGLTDSLSFPVGKQSRQRVKDAVDWLTKPEREGKTWAILCQPAQVGNRKEPASVVLALPEERPEQAPELAGLFAPLSAEAAATMAGNDFAATAERVAVAVEGIWRGHLNASVQVVVITSYDKGRLKTLLSESHTARHLVESARCWQEGCGNIPPLFFRIMAKGETLFFKPRPPFPSQLFDVLTTVWLRQGQDHRTTRKLSPDLPARLLLASGQDGAAMARSILAEHLNDLVPGLVGLAYGTKVPGKELVLFNESRRLKQLAWFAPSLLGLLLHKAGRRKEDYMHGSHFLVGRMLSLADTLHCQYCIKERGEGVSLPPRLLGNALFRTALEFPAQALEQLAERLPIYQAWATTSKDASGLAKWTLARLGEVATELEQAGIPTSTNEIGKAELLLGYLATYKKQNDDPGDETLSSDNDGETLP